MTTKEVLEERIKNLKEEIGKLEEWAKGHFETIYSKIDKKKGGITILGALKG